MADRGVVARFQDGGLEDELKRKILEVIMEAIFKHGDEVQVS
jgi:hypothetical protein